MFGEYGTVTTTAEAPHLTPSAVSQQLRLLAKEVGVELLRREGRLVPRRSSCSVTRILCSRNGNAPALN